MLIVHFLTNMFKLYLTSTIINSNEIDLNGVIFRKELNSRINEGFIGFFDWLRGDKSTIVGIRICYFEHQIYNELLRSLPYIQTNFDGKCMELSFKGDPYNPNLSDDQDFTNNFVYISDQNGYLFTFGLDSLSEVEHKSLVTYCQEL